jgi:hypothetical protein
MIRRCPHGEFDRYEHYAVEVVAETVAEGLVEVAVAVGGGADGGLAEVVLIWTPPQSA